MLPVDTILQGECSQVMAGLPDDCIDLVVTSPPYDQLRDYTGYTFDFEAIARQLYRVTKIGGVVVWVVGDQTVNGSESGTSFEQALGFKRLGFNLHDTMIYNRFSPFPSNVRYWQCFEYMFVLSKGKPACFNPLRESRNEESKKRRKYGYQVHTQRNRTGKLEVADEKAMTRLANRDPNTRMRTNIWEYCVGYTTANIAHQHPAIFPEALARDHILSWSNPGDLVFDPMVGSGTTCKMAKELGRHWLGIDISQEYVDLARRRVANAKVPLFTL